jgi:arylsulfatase A-like enzyme
MRVANRVVGTICALALLLLMPVGGAPAGAVGDPDRSSDPASASAPGRRPNILLIVSDDQAWSVFSRKLMPSVYEQLVDRGVLFKRAYVNTSLCCPSRAEILTGLYEHNTGVDDNDVPLTRPTIVEALKDRGYRTYLAGKYLNSWNSCEPRPEFDEWACVVSHEPSSNSLKDPVVNVNGSWRTLFGYQPDVLGSILADDIQSTPDDQPFLALFAPTTPHLPADDPRYASMEVSPPRGRAFDSNTLSGNAPRFARRTPLTQDEIRKSDERYVAMARATRSFDDAVSSLLGALGGREQDTMVIYISDNGFLYGEHRRFGKNDAWEEAMRVPMVVRYPAALAPAQAFATNALVQNVDIAPTIADLAGFPWGADGRSFLPLVSRDRLSIRSAALLEHCRGVSRGTLDCSGLLFEGANTNTPGFVGLVTPRYKYVRYDDGSTQLVDLGRDPRELRNLLGARRSSGNKRAVAVARRMGDEIASLTRTAAVTTIAAGPGPLDTRVATFRYFSPSLTAQYRCRLTRDGRAGAWEPCQGETITYSDLADGRYRFEVAGSDGAGRPDPTPATREFTVVTRRGPPVVLGAHPPAVIQERSATFTYTSVPTSAPFICRLVSAGDEGTWTACPPEGITFTDLADGNHTFEILARDPATNRVSDPATAWSFRVDNAGPVVTFLDAPAVSTRSDRADFRFFLDEGISGGVRCSIDGGQAADCTSGTFRADRLRGGLHTLTIAATDPSGNRSETPYTWEVDRDRPAVGIKGGPNPISSDRDAVFDLWSDASPAFFLCRLDSDPWMPCFTAAQMTSLAQGKHRFVALALDAALNRSEQVVFRWTVDAIAPGLVLTGSPEQGATTTSHEARFDIAANEPVTYFCSLDGAPHVQCGPHPSYTGLGAGEHSFSAYVVDHADNASIDVGRTWTVT